MRIHVYAYGKSPAVIRVTGPRDWPYTTRGCNRRRTHLDTKAYIAAPVENDDRAQPLIRKGEDEKTRVAFEYTGALWKDRGGSGCRADGQYKRWMHFPSNQN